MTFVIPTAVDLMTDSVNSHPNARGGFAGVGEGLATMRLAFNKQRPFKLTTSRISITMSSNLMVP